MKITIEREELFDYIDNVMKGNIAEILGANYEAPIPAEQQEKNIFLTGYEWGCANACNAIRAKVKRMSKGGDVQ